MFFAQTFTPTPSLHQKLTEHWKCYMHNNQLPAKTLFKLNDISSGYVRMLMISSTLGFETNQVCMSYLEVATMSSFYH